MPIQNQLITIALTQVLQIPLNFLMNHFFSSRQPDLSQNLRQFLDVLSRDFSSKVEETVRVAFYEHDFDTIKSQIILSYDTYLRYQSSISKLEPLGRIEFIEEAKHDIDKAYSLLVVVVDKIIRRSAEIGSFSPSWVKSYREITKLSLTAFGFFTSIDQLITEQYLIIYPNHQAYIKQRLDSYEAYFENLLKIYHDSHQFRISAKETRLFWPDSWNADYDRFSSVYPKKDFIQNNMKFWVFLLDNTHEIAVQSATMQTDYIDRDVIYKHDLISPARVRASQARSASDKLCKTLSAYIPYSDDEATQDKFVTDIVKLLREAKIKLEYIITHNILIEAIEGGLTFSQMANLTHISEEMLKTKLASQFNMMTPTDKEKFLTRVIDLQNTEFFNFIFPLCNLSQSQHSTLLKIAFQSTLESEIIQTLLSKIDSTTLGQLVNFDKNTPEVALQLKDEFYLRLLKAYADPDKHLFNQWFYRSKFEVTHFNRLEVNSGQSLLHLAIINEDNHLIDYLLEREVSPSLLNQVGEMASEIATRLQIQPDLQFYNENKLLKLIKSYNYSIRFSEQVKFDELFDTGIDANYRDSETNENMVDILNKTSFEIYKPQGYTEWQNRLFMRHQNGQVYCIDLVGSNCPQLMEHWLTGIRAGMVLTPKNFGSKYNEMENYRDEGTANSFLHEIIGLDISEEQKIRILDSNNAYYSKQLIFSRNSQNRTVKQTALYLNLHLLVNFFQKLEDRSAEATSNDFDGLKLYAENQDTKSNRLFYSVYFELNNVYASRVNKIKALEFLKYLIENDFNPDEEIDLLSDPRGFQFKSRTFIGLVKDKLRDDALHGLMFSTKPEFFVEALKIVNQSHYIKSSLGQRVEDGLLQISNQILPNITLEHKLLIVLLYWFNKKYHDMSSPGNFNHPMQLLGLTICILFLMRSATKDLYRKKEVMRANDIEPNIMRI